MSEGRLTIRIISPEHTVFEGKAEAIFLPGTAGPFEVLAGHAPLISSLCQGNISVREADGARHDFPIRGGVARVLQNRITVCVD